MEDFEKQIINGNLPELLLTIHVNTLLLARIEQTSNIGGSDLEPFEFKFARSDRVKYLLDILKTRTGAFSILIHALHCENQSGALKVLTQGLLQCPNNSITSKIFVGIPYKIRSFILDGLKDRHKKLAFLLTESVHYSLQRIKEHLHENSFSYKENSLSCGEQKCTEASRTIISKNDKWIHLTCYSTCITIMHSTCHFPEDSQHIYKIRDTFSWPSLSEDKQKCLLEQNITFQGKALKFNSVVNKISETTKENEQNILKKIEEMFLLKLLENQEPEVASGNVPNLTESYIPRRLISRQRISKRVISITKQSSESDVLVYKGENFFLYNLASMVGKYGDKLCDTSTEQLKNDKISVNNILLNENDDFADLCKRLNDELPFRSVHLLECRKIGLGEGAKDFTLYWIKTLGSVKQLQLYVHKDLQEIDEGKLLSQVPRSICIADSPGMGKTCLLVKCADELIRLSKNSNSLCYVQYITMSNFLNTYQSILNQRLAEYDHQKNAVIESLIKSSSEFVIGRLYVRSLFNDSSQQSTLKIHLMFDGIDELSKVSYQKAKDLIEYVGNEDKFSVTITLWVATRTQSIQEIEEAMSVMGFNIQPFNKRDQVNLFTNCWGGSEEMVSLANKCIDKFNETLTMTDDNNDIVGRPLLCALLARIYEKEAKKVQKTQQFEESITNLTIDKIYKTYVDGKFDITNAENQHLDADLAYLRHLEIALERVFPDFPENLNGFFTTSQISNRDVQKYGLLEFGSPTEPLRFVHFTIAQFIAAQSIMYILKNYSQFQNEKYKKIVRHVLRVKNSSTILSDIGVKKYEISHKQLLYKNVCFFFNNALGIDRKLDTIQRLDSRQKFLSNLDSNLIDTLTTLKDGLDVEKTLNSLVATTKSNFYNIACVLIQALSGKLSQDNLDDTITKHVITGLIFLASKFSSFELAREIFGLVQSWNNSVPITSYWMCELSSSDINDSEINSSDINPSHIIPSDSSFIYSDNKPSQTLADSDLLISDNVSRILTPLHCAVESGNYVLTCHLLSPESIQADDEVEQVSKLFTTESIQNVSPQNERDEAESVHFQELSEDRNIECVRKLKPTHFNFRYLLHYCLLNTITNPPNVISKKQTILRFFQEQIPYLINDNPACVGICLERIHLKLLTSYLKIKHELNPDWHFLSTNKYGENMLHLLAAGHYDNDMTSEKYHKALVELQDIGINVGRHLLQFNHMHWRAVDVAVGSMDLLDETFKMFGDLRVKFDFVDFRGSTTLFKAVSGQRNGLILQKLLDLDATCRPKYFGETILHTAASFYNFDAVEYFVNKRLIVDIQPKTSDKSPNFRKDHTSCNSRYLIYHLERIQHYLLEFDKENLASQLSHHLEHIMYQLEHLPYNLERLRHLLTQMLYNPKGFAYTAKDIFRYKRHLLHNCNHLLNNLGKLCQGRHNKTRIVNVQNDEGNTPLHMCFTNEKGRLEFMQSSLRPDLKSNEYIKLPETSSPVKRRFNDGNPIIGSPGSRKNSIETDVSDDEQNSQVEIQSNTEKSSESDLIKSLDQLRRISLYQQYFDLEPNNQHKIISFLIENGAKISVPNKDLITPMDLAIELCLNGLVNEEHDELLNAQKILFSDSKYMSLALKGLLLNLKLGYIWHPNLIRTFADAIRTLHGDVAQKNDSDNASLLHLAAEKHSLFGIKYLIEQKAIPLTTSDLIGRNALDYMTCDPDNCKTRNCKEIRTYLTDALEKNSNVSTV